MREKKSGECWTGSLTTASPSSLPTTSRKISVMVRKKQKDRARAFENETIVRGEDVVKCPRFLSKLEKYPARAASENID